MAGALHPLLVPEVQRWLGEGPHPPELEGLLQSLSLRLELLEGLEDADGAGELEAFFRLSADLLLVLDEELRILHLNGAFEALGWGVAACRGRPVTGLLAPGDRDTAELTLRSVLRTREQVPLATRVVDAAGAQRTVHWLLTTDQAGRRVYAVGRDVSEQQTLEQRLAQAQRLQAVGQLAAGVAHELNTPLQFLGDNVHFLAESLGELLPVLSMAERRADFDPALKEAVARADVAYLRQELPGALTAVTDGLKRVRDLVRGLKELAPSDGERVEATERVDVVPALRAVVAAVAEAALAGRTVRVELAPLPPLVCHVGGLTRVLDILLSNAALAVAARHGPGGGEVVVATTQEGAQAVLTVRDDGGGIPEAVRSRIFEPFFTTREVGQGRSGQSLAVARSIVDRHHGTISFETEEGVGTTFTVRLPLPASAVRSYDELWG